MVILCRFTNIQPLKNALNEGKYWVIIFLPYKSTLKETMSSKSPYKECTSITSVHDPGQKTASTEPHEKKISRCRLKA
jgi:hypothetical protein